jgi:hemerythrin-like domain-containing protein
MADIMQILADDHANMSALIDLLEREIDRLDAEGHADVDMIAAVAEYLLEYPDRFHHPAEDLILARLDERGAAPADAAHRLAEEHERIGRMARDLNEAAHAVASEQPIRRDAFVACVRDYIAALRRHMQMEDSLFFPLARRSLDAEDRAVLAARIPELDDPLFGTATRERYRRLGAALLER